MVTDHSLVVPGCPQSSRSSRKKCSSMFSRWRDHRVDGGLVPDGG